MLQNNQKVIQKVVQNNCKVSQTNSKASHNTIRAHPFSTAYYACVTNVIFINLLDITMHSVPIQHHFLHSFVFSICAKTLTALMIIIRGGL